MKTTSIVFLLGFVISWGYCNPIYNEIEQCKDVCADFLLPLETDAQNICQRGCRFFNLIDLKDEKDLNETKNDCYISCNESYDLNSFQTCCITGCNAMSKKKQTEMPDFFLFMEQESQLNQQDIESFETDVFNDPIIRNQLIGGEYKIPETFIRTMPLNHTQDPRDYALRLTKRWLCFYWSHLLVFFLACVAVLSVAAPVLFLYKNTDLELNKPLLNWFLFVENEETEEYKKCTNVEKPLIEFE